MTSIMKKRIISFLLVTLMMACTAVPAFARASDYLDDYYVDLYSPRNGTMSVAVVVNGVGVLDKIGIRRIDIEQKVNGTWTYYDTLDAVDHPEFYTYNARTYLNEILFDGTPGVSYRVTVMVYAQRGSGSDTGYIPSMAATCK